MVPTGGLVHINSPMHKFHSLSLSFLILLAGSMLLSACSPTETEIAATPAPSASPESTITVTLTPTAEQVATTPPLLQQTVVLIAAEEAEESLRQIAVEVLSELAAADGLEFEVRSTLSQTDLSPQVRVVAALPPDPGLAALAESAPETQFLGIAIPGLEPRSNLTVISADGIRPDTIGFLAGYLAAVATPEWRVGVINSSSGVDIDHREGFLNGVVYFCGLCRQTYPPYFNYPLFSEAPAGATSPEWQAAADILVNSAVNTVYITPGSGDETLLEYLAEAGVNLIGTTPPPDGLIDQWIATVSGDISSALQQAWPDLITGQSGAVYSAPLAVTHINPDLLSPGRQRLVDKMIAEISAGFIDTGTGTTSDSP